MQKVGTVALLVAVNPDSASGRELIAAISDAAEILVLESALRSGDQNPLEVIQAYRDQQSREEEEFGDYVEDLLVRTGGLRPDIREHAVQWFQSKAKIERYRKIEADATSVIAKYAYEVFNADPTRREFMLAGPSAEVKIRVFEFKKAQSAAA
jgi:hypothetical protein